MIALSSPTTGEFGLAPVKRYSRAAHATSNSLSFVPVLTDFGYCSTTRVALSFRERVAEREREVSRVCGSDSSCLFSAFHLTFQSLYHLSSNFTRSDRILSSFPFSIKKRSIIVRVTENVPPEIRLDVRSDTSTSFRSNLMINSLPNSLIVRTVSITLATSGVYLVPEKRIRRRSHSPILVDPIDRVPSFPEGGRKGWIDNRSYILFLEYITSLSKLCRGCEQRGRGGRAGTFGTYKARFRSTVTVVCIEKGDVWRGLESIIHRAFYTPLLLLSLSLSLSLQLSTTLLPYPSPIYYFPLPPPGSCQTVVQIQFYAVVLISIFTKERGEACRRGKERPPPTNNTISSSNNNNRSKSSRLCIRTADTIRG